MFKSQGRPWPLTKNVVYKEVFNYFSKAKNIFNSFFLYFIEKNKKNPLTNVIMSWLVL